MGINPGFVSAVKTKRLSVASNSPRFASTSVREIALQTYTIVMPGTRMRKKLTAARLGSDLPRLYPPMNLPSQKKL